MKKVCFLLVCIGIFCSCSKYSLLCSDADAVEQNGIKHFQKFVEQVEKFKSENGKYPKEIKEIGKSIFDEGELIPDKRITQSSYRLIPEENRFSVEFFFDREKNCLTLVGNNRICKYTSETGKWSCY